MTTRLQFHEEMRRLEDDLVGMSDVVSGALESAIASLRERDRERAENVIANDEIINARYAAIEREVLELIATQQPMAGDLREILAVSAVATSLERIGDYAKGISRIALRVMDEPEFELVPALARMDALVRELLAAAVDTFIHRDADAATELAVRDDELDELYELAYHELTEEMMSNRRAIEPAGRQLWVAKSLERIGDHVTNIAERVVFVVTAEIVELNP